MVPHALLRYQVTSRGYGAASARIRGKWGWVGKEAAREEGRGEDGRGPPNVGVIDEEESGFVRVRRKNWARLIAKVHMDDPQLCPRCGKEMKVLAALSSPAQDAVIEKIHPCWGAPSAVFT